MASMVAGTKGVQRARIEVPCSLFAAEAIGRAAELLRSFSVPAQPLRGAWARRDSRSRPVERGDDRLAHRGGTHRAAAFLRDVGRAQALVEHKRDGPLNAVGGRALVEGIAQG